MNRVFAVIGNCRSDESRQFLRAIRSRLQLAPDWASVIDTSSLLLCRRRDAHNRIVTHHIGRSSVVLGTLFPRTNISDGGSASAVSALSMPTQKEICETHGRALVDQFWGQYLAVLSDEDGTVRVVRDPSGSQACYFVSNSGLVVVFSHLQDFLEIASIPLTVNYEHLLTFLHLSFFAPSEETGFIEIRQLLAGASLSVRDSEWKTAWLWNAPEFARRGDLLNKEGYTTALQGAVRQVVQSWATCHSRIYHELSGGLDSAIVLSCLVAAPSRPHVVCANYYTQDAEGDERLFARKMAKQAGVELVEAPIRNQLRRDINEFVQAAAVPSPLQGAFICEDDVRRPPIIREHQLEAIFSGQGGDQLFHRGVKQTDAADFLRVHRSLKGFLGVLFSTAQATTSSIWTTLRAALYHGVLTRKPDIWQHLRARTFIRAEPSNLATSVHPWWSEAADLPPSKFCQLMSIADAQAYWARECAYADEIFPLMSQPLIETALSIPTYVLSHGGAERALVREAFSDVVPPEILCRFSKGAVDHHFHEFIFQHRELIREFLADGLLAKANLLDRDELQRFLSNPELLTRGQMNWPITIACKAEMWLREAQTLQTPASPVRTRKILIATGA